MPDSEKRIYYDIIVKCWNVFSKTNPYPEFSDEWWSRLVGDFDEIRAIYKGTDYEEFVNELTMRLQNEHERRMKVWKQQ